jgi:hypothetical protein
MNIRNHFASTVVAILVCTLARADVDMSVDNVTGQQIGITGDASVGMVVSASSNAYSMTTAAGFNFTCDRTTTNIPAKAGLTEHTTSIFGGVRQLITVPAPVPGSYTVASFPSWNFYDIHVCGVQWTARSVEGAATISGSGAGVSLSFTGSTESARDDVKQFQMVRIPLFPLPPVPGECIK